MSDFIDRLMAVDTGQRSGAPGPFDFSVKEEKIHAELKVGYSVRAQWSQNIMCHPEDLPHAIHNVRRQLTQAVYGDFYSLLISLDRALIERNLDDARIAMTKIWNEVK